MYDLNYKSLFKQLNYGILFMGASFVIFVLFVIAVFDAQVKRDYFYETNENAGVIDNCHSMEAINECRPIFIYMVGDREYSCESRVISRDEINHMYNDVYYDGDFPETCITEYDKDVSLFGYLIMLVPLAFIATTIISISKNLYKILKLRKLAKTGKLVRGLDYKMVPSHLRVKKRNLLSISIDYKLPNGKVVKLVGEPRFDGKELDEDRKVDLLIDLNNPKNYHIEFNIKKK